MQVIIGVISSFQRISSTRASFKIVKCKILETKECYQKAT